MVRWGILGLGSAANSFANAIKEVENAKLISIASLSKNKNFIIGKKFNIEKKYQFNSYEDLINCEEIDAVYIATLNNKHADLIIKVAKAKKGILCEKPFALNETELNDVVTQLNKTKVFFLENIAYRSHPQTPEIIRSEGKASTSFLQRKLQIGYNRAARIIDMMEADGIVSKANHVGKRDVL